MWRKSEDNTNYGHIMKQWDEFRHEIHNEPITYMNQPGASYDIDSDNIQPAIKDLNSTISNNVAVYQEKDFFINDSARQLYDDIKNNVASTTADDKALAEVDQAKQNKFFLGEINRMAGKTSNQIDYSENRGDPSQRPDLKNDQTNNLQYVTGENSISNKVKNGSEAMDNLYRTSLPNFVLYLRIAIMAISLTFIYFLLREYRYFSRKATEVEMKIAALSCVNRNSFASSAFVESIVLNDDTTENRNSLKSIKKYSRKLKKRDIGKK